jgi:hypothetical protein
MEKEEFLASALIFVMCTGGVLEKCSRKTPPHTHNEIQIPEQFSFDTQSANATPTVEWLLPLYEIEDIKK